MVAFLKCHPRMFRFFLAHAAYTVRFLCEIFMRDLADAAPPGFLNVLKRKPRVVRTFKGYISAVFHSHEGNGLAADAEVEVVSLRRDVPMPLPVEVIPLESPLAERIGRSHCSR